MKTAALGAALAAAMALPALAQTAADQRELNDARHEYQQALRSHDQQAIARARTRLSHAYGDTEQDRVALAEADKPPPPGVPRPLYERLVRARDDYRQALDSGDRARIQQTRQELSGAYHNMWVFEHQRRG